MCVPALAPELAVAEFNEVFADLDFIRRFAKVVAKAVPHEAACLWDSAGDTAISSLISSLDQGKRRLVRELGDDFAYKVTMRYPN